MRIEFISLLRTNGDTLGLTSFCIGYSENGKNKSTPPIVEKIDPTHFRCADGVVYELGKISALHWLELHTCGLQGTPEDPIPSGAYRANIFCSPTARAF